MDAWGGYSSVPTFESVDEYLASLTDEQRAVVAEIRQRVLAVAPAATRGHQVRHADLAAGREVARARRCLEAARLALPGPARGRRRAGRRPGAVRRREGHPEDPVRRGRLRPDRAGRAPAGRDRASPRSPSWRRGRSSSRRRRRRAGRAAAVAGRTSRGPCSRPAPTRESEPTAITPKTTPSRASWSPVWPADSFTNCGRKATKKTIVFGLVRPTVKPTRSDRSADARSDRGGVDGVERGPGVGAVPDRLDAEPDDVRRPGDLQRDVGLRRSRRRRRRGRRRPAGPGS